MGDDSAKRGCGTEKAKKRIRVLIARFNLDGHDRGVLTVMHALRNMGMEVIYMRFGMPREIVKSAVEECVDIIGITSSQGEHLLVCSMLMAELRKNEANIPVIVGGVVPSVDVIKLKEMGIREVFGPGSKPADAVSFIFDIIGDSAKIEGRNGHNMGGYGRNERGGDVGRNI